jgi:hypothetical protein
MTARGFLDRRIRKVHFVIFFGIALFVGAIIAQQALGMPNWVWIPGLIGFGAAWLTIVAIPLIGFFPCPFCQGNLTTLVMGRFRLDPRICFCPYCGKTWTPKNKRRIDEFQKTFDGSRLSLRQYHAGPR